MGQLGLRLKNHGLVIFLFLNFIMLVAIGFYVKSASGESIENYKDDVFEKYIENIQKMKEYEEELSRGKVVVAAFQNGPNEKEVKNTYFKAGRLLATLKKKVVEFDYSNEEAQETIIVDIGFYSERLEENIEKLRGLEKSVYSE